MQTYNILSSAIPNAPKIIPFPHPHCFYALSIFLLVLHFDGGFTNFYIFQQYFVVQKPNKVSKIDFQNLANCLTKRSKHLTHTYHSCFCTRANYVVVASFARVARAKRAPPARSERYLLTIWLPWLVAQPSTCRSCLNLYDNWNRKPVRKVNVSKPADI